MGCRDKSINYLKSLGYNVVLLPKADMRPLELLSGGGRGLDRFGQLTTVLVGDGSVPVPPVGADQPAPNISGKRSSELKVGLGLSVLGNVIAAMGGSNLGLKASYQNATTMAFEFVGVFENRIEVAALDRYLGSADIDPLSRQAMTFLENDDIYVVTATIKSTKFSVIATDKTGAELSVDVPVIKEVIGGNIDVSAASSAQSLVTYEGPVPLVFGFQAVQLFFDDGIYRAMKPAEDTTAKALSEWRDENTVPFMSAAPMVRLRD